MSHAAATRGGGQGQKPGIGNFGKEETMHMLGMIETVLPIGPEGWMSMESEHGVQFLGRRRSALVRKCSTLHRRQIPTVDPDFPEEVKLANQIRHLIGNTVALGDVEEEFDFKEAGLGKSHADPSPNPGASSASASQESTEAARTVVTPNSNIKREVIKLLLKKERQ